MTLAQQHYRNAQAQLWHGGTEPALFLCLLHQSNRDRVETKRGGQRKKAERKAEAHEGGGREEKLFRCKHITKEIAYKQQV